MKHTRYLYAAAAVALLFASTALPSLAQSENQSLGAYARSVRKPKNGSSANASPKVYDNDNLPAEAAISVVGSSDDASSAPKPQAGEQAKDPSANPAEPSDAKKSDSQIKPGQSVEERQKALEAWKGKLDEQKEKVAGVSHELDLLEREYRLKAAEFYSNTANRVQHPYGFADEDAKYKQQIADKHKELEDAQGKLSDMQEDARKEGAPNSVTE